MKDDKPLYERMWEVKDTPLLWIELIHHGDVHKMDKLFGIQYGGHKFNVRNQTATFYRNKETAERASLHGKEKFSNSEFVNNFCEHSKTAENRLKEQIRLIEKSDLKLKSNPELLQMYLDFFDVYSELAGIYRCTRHDFYSLLTEQIKQNIPEPKEEVLTKLLNNEHEKISQIVDDKIKLLSVNLYKIGKRRFGMHETWLNSFVKAEALFKEIGNRLGLSSLEIKNCLSSEIKSFLLGETKPNKEEIIKRISYFELEYTDDGFRIITGKDKLDEEELCKELVGVCANPGKAKARVFILKESLRGIFAEQMKRMSKGDILVATNTSPDMMLAIEKASAIITDEGGMLCHAAVVSREFGIPCIVGTRNATKFLKEGDLIEVDAEKGIVRRMKKEFVFWWKDYVTMISPAACIRTLKFYSHLPGNDVKDYMMLAVNSELRFLVSKEGIQSITEQGKKYLDKEFFRKYLQDMSDARKRYYSKVDEINSLNARELSNEQLGKYLLEMADLAAEGIAYYWGSQYEPMIVTEQKLKSILSRKYKGKDLEEVFAAVVTPLEFDNILREELDFIDIAQNNEIFSEQLMKSHGKKYSWLFRNTFDMGVCFNFLNERFEKYNKLDLKAKEWQMHLKKKMLALKQKEVADEFGNETAELMDIFHKLSLNRMETKFVFAGFEFLLYDLLKEISNRINIPFADMVKYASAEEIAKILNKEIEISDETIRQRKDFYAIINENGKVNFRYGAKEFAKIKEEFPELFEEKEMKELRGTTANSGKARGRVVIVPAKDLESLQEINKRFNHGDILVTPMTQPNTVILMEKAGAIITDEGGLTSHAAIISREFGIPCVVGTLEATRILKDGDLVEVDADKGIVRKIE